MSIYWSYFVAMKLGRPALYLLKIASTHCIQIFYTYMDLQSNLDVVRLGKLAELPLRLIESEPRDPCNDDVLRDNSAAISLTLRAWGNDGWNKHGLCNIHTGHLEIISQDARNALFYVLIKYAIFRQLKIKHYTIDPFLVRSILPM